MADDWIEAQPIPDGWVRAPITIGGYGLRGGTIYRILDGPPNGAMYKVMVFSDPSGNFRLNQPYYIGDGEDEFYLDTSSMLGIAMK